MPGILAVLSDKELINEVTFEKMRLSLMHESFYNTADYKSQQAFVSAIYLNESDLKASKCVKYDGTVSVFVYGRIFNPEHRKAIAELGKAVFIAQKYVQEGLSFIRNLNGEFNILIVDEKCGQSHLVNDRFGQRPWYMFSANGNLIVSPEIKAILLHPAVSREIDPICLVGILQYNKMRLCKRTLFQGIHIMQPASIFTWDNGALQERQYWIMKDLLLASTEKDVDDLKLPTLADDLTDLFKEALLRRIPESGSNMVLFLTGGLDSRALAAIMHHEHINTVALTYGIPESDEVRLAQEVASRLGMNHHILPLYPEDFIEYASQVAIHSDELDIFVQGVQQKVNRYIRTLGNIAVFALALDHTMGGSLITPDVLAVRDKDDVFELLHSQNCMFDTMLLSRTLQPILQEALLGLEQEIRDHVEQMSPLPASNRYDLALLESRCIRIVMLRYQSVRFEIDTIAPSYDNDFIDGVLGLPMSVRFNHRLYWHFMRRLSTDLADIPYQGTMLPANVPVDFWERGYRLEAEREKLYRDIWTATGGKVFIPYKRFYTNFDEWIRTNPTWQRFLKDLLMSDKTICTREYFQRETVVQLLNEHMGGKANHRQRIIYIASIELFLRTYFH